MESEVLVSNPLITYLSTTNDENRSGVWEKGHKGKTAENFPGYEAETKTMKPMCAVWHWLGRGRYLKSGISTGVYLQNHRLLYTKPVWFQATVWENIMKSWNTFGFPSADPASLYRGESTKPKSSISWDWVLYPLFFSKKEIACVIMDPSLDLWHS